MNFEFIFMNKNTGYFLEQEGFLVIEWVCHHFRIKAKALPLSKETRFSN